MANMNLASWIILAVVVAVLALAVKATFFKKKPRGGCCDTGDKQTDDLNLNDLLCSSGCEGCASRNGCASARNSLQPTYKTLE
jgi:hypothetical protein